MLGLGAALWTLRALGEDDDRTRRPLTAMVEAIRIVRALLRGEPLPAPGQVFPFRADASLSLRAAGAMPAGGRGMTPVQAAGAMPAANSAIPVYVGAVNARMLRAAGAWADGVQLGAIVSPGYAAWAWAQVARGAAEAGRDPSQLDLASNVLLSVDGNARAARDAVRTVLAYYIHRVEPVVLSTSGADPDEVAHIRTTVLERGVEAGASQISDPLIDTFAAAGDPDQVAERLQAYLAVGLRGVLAWHVIGPDRGRSLRLLAETIRPRLFG
jgi:5,10-methylenetetrahydromethanopterin reductase